MKIVILSQPQIDNGRLVLWARDEIGSEGSYRSKPGMPLTAFQHLKAGDSPKVSRTEIGSLGGDEIPFISYFFEVLTE